MTFRAARRRRSSSLRESFFSKEFLANRHSFRNCQLLLHQQDLFHPVNLGELDFNHFIRGGLDFASDEGGFNRQFPMAAVDENAKLYSARTSLGKQRIECGADCPAGIEHIVDQHDVHVLYGKGKLQFLNNWPRTDSRKVVAIERNVQSPDRNEVLVGALENHIFNDLTDSFGHGHASAANADQSEASDTVLFNDLICEANQAAFDVRSRK